MTDEPSALDILKAKADAAEAKTDAVAARTAAEITAGKAAAAAASPIPQAPTPVAPFQSPPLRPPELDLGIAPKSQMSKVPEPEYTDATKAEIVAGKRAADDWTKRREAEQEVGRRLSARGRTPRV